MRTAHRLLPALLGVAVAAAALLGAPAAQAASGSSADPLSALIGGPTCGGTTIAKTGGGSWTCAFDDEFDGSSLDSSRWATLQTSTSGYHSGAECYTDSAQTVSVSGGTLKLTASRTAKPFTCSDPNGDYTSSVVSGMVSTAGRYTQTYGRFEVRAALPAATVQGLQESFWLWPANSSKYGSAWPASGEMDIAETYSRYNNRAVPYVHYNAAKADPNVTNNNCIIKDVTAFHSYVLEWTSTQITVSYDGTTCLKDEWNPAKPLARSAPFDQPFELSLTQALGIGTNASTAKTPLPATTSIDYVRIWK